MRWIITFILILLFSCREISVDKKILDVKTNKTNTAVETIKKKAVNGILVCAHRSYHKNAPENSLKSILLAIENQIDIVEIDVRTTKDSFLILMHDDSIGRVTNGNGFIKDYTYSELQKFNLKIGDSITGEKIPLLHDALILAKGKVIPNLDLKAVDYNQLYDLLKSIGMAHDVISFIGKKKKVQEMIAIDSLYAVLPLSKTKEDILFYLENTKSQLQHFTDESFTEGNMDWMLKKGELIFVNTLWDEDDDFILGNTASMDSVIALKPTIIQTDHPLLLIDYLKRKKLGSYGH